MHFRLEIAETTSFTEERRRKITRIENLRQIERYTFTKVCNVFSLTGEYSKIQ